MKVAGYVRLSRDEDKESYSSILSQKRIIEECADINGWGISKYYEDDNCSGYTFDRPAMEELMKDLEKGQIDIIIAKDLSRIGRHNAYTLLFLEKIKRMNKRLILPREGRGYDTDQDESDLLGITTWFNEMYVKDISRKIKSSIKAKQKEGRLIIKEVFGYKRSILDKHMLEIDEEAAIIVRRIFKLYLSGIGYRKIAEQLNSEHCPTPSQYHVYGQRALYQGTKCAAQWNSVHVQRILKNDIYTGTLRLAKTEKKTIKGRSYKLPEEQQYVFLNNHPAIISKDIFEEVQNISVSRQKDHSKGAASLKNVFSGLLKCSNCGSYMIAYNKKDKPRSYICGNYHRQGRKACERHSIKEDFLKEAAIDCIKSMTVLYSDEISGLLQSTCKISNKEEELLLDRLRKEQQQYKVQLRLLILQKITDIKRENTKEYLNIMEESYFELEDSLKKQLHYVSTKIAQLEHKLSSAESKSILTPQEIMAGIIKEGQLMREDAQILIDKILIDSKGNSTIYMKADLRALCYHIREDVNLVPDQ